MLSFADLTRIFFFWEPIHGFVARGYSDDYESRFIPPFFFFDFEATRRPVRNGRIFLSEL